MGINTSLSPALSNFFRQKMRRLNQISRTYSFESTKISIWFGACKMRRFNWALVTVTLPQYSLRIFHRYLAPYSSLWLAA